MSDKQECPVCRKPLTSDNSWFEIDIPTLGGALEARTHKTCLQMLREDTDLAENTAHYILETLITEIEERQKSDAGKHRTSHDPQQG